MRIRKTKTGQGRGVVAITLASIGLLLAPFAAAEEPKFSASLIFLSTRSTIMPGIVECPNGDLLVSWYRGSGNARPTM